MPEKDFSGIVRRIPAHIGQVKYSGKIVLDIRIRAVFVEIKWSADAA